MVYLLWGVGILVGSYGLHRILLKMEEWGWIYYKKKPQGAGIGSALQEMNALLNPNSKVVKERKFEVHEEDKAEEGPFPSSLSGPVKDD